MNTHETKTIDTLTPAPAATLPRRALADVAPAIPGNDNGAPAAARDTTPLVAHPDVVGYLRATLRRHGVPAYDLPDAIAEVQTTCIAAARARRMPADLAEWKAFAAAIALRRAVDRLRETAVRGRYDGHLSREAEARAPTAHDAAQGDVVDAKRHLAALKSLFDAGEMPADAAEILWGEAEHVPHAQIAAELGITEAAVRKRLFRIRAKFRAQLAALGMLTVALLVVGLLAQPRPLVRAPERPLEGTPSARGQPAWDAGTPPPDNSRAGAGRKDVLPD
ncbi:MAG: sigma-70 family RNA polymerase sigma factor [Myxococcota bacterium]|nr:sigma-70 family RNA polymerase sigma factor [Myxococcota bacterium]